MNKDCSAQSGTASDPHTQSGAYRSAGDQHLMGGFVRGPKLLEILFPERTSGLSLKSLQRYTRRRLIPSIKIGRNRLYSPGQVREALLNMGTKNRA